MAIVLSVDIGTTKITSLALDVAQDEVLAAHALPNDAEITPASRKAQGWSEWDAECIVQRACECLRAVGEQLGALRSGVAGVGITGQQHGVVLLDEANAPVTPLINWLDRRGEENFPGTDRTYVEEAIRLVGEEAAQRTGCRLAPGYMGVTLFWMKAKGLLPASGTACFLTDYFGSFLTGECPLTDPTMAASSGLLNVPLRTWDKGATDALGLRISLLPDIREAGQRFGVLIRSAAELTGLPAGLPVSVPLGDSQASFVGCVRDRENCVLVNVGTGAQVSAYSEKYAYAPPLEARPFPRRGHLLVYAEPCGGWSYAVLEGFFRSVGQEVLGLPVAQPLYDIMNRLAASVPSGADGIRCQPFFGGSRANPELRAAWTGVSAENFTPAHMTRALLEGVASCLCDGYGLIRDAAGRPFGRMVGGGNALRENPVLASILSEQFSMPIEFPRHREEAAVGAALISAPSAG